jgi:hypothetical protein
LPQEKLSGLIALHFPRLPADWKAFGDKSTGGMLTQENHISTLALLNLALACGNLSGNASLPQG